MFRYFLYLFSLISSLSYGQSIHLSVFDQMNQDSVSTPSFSCVEEYEKKINAFYNEIYLASNLVDFKKYASDSIPVFNEAAIKRKLHKLNEQSPIEFEYNKVTKSTINVYINKKRTLTSKMLSASKIYFPLFEEQLIIHELPIELKYLPIIESALNPNAKSRVGAVGLWQFMPQTAKMMGLSITSYIDERRDPVLSTKAACKYLKHLFSIYNDWNIALAAYNAGPGNVNKAIRRSGGKASYWEIRSFLPIETQNYIPLFIAVNYIMNYAYDHNIKYDSPEFLPYEVDTVHVSARIKFNILEEWLSIDKNILKSFNPMYINNVIPKDEKIHPLKLPVFLIGDYILLQDSISKYSAINSKVVSSIQNNIEYYTIKAGDTIWDIAKKYNNLSVSDIKNLNSNLDVYHLKAGTKIKILNSD